MAETASKTVCFRVGNTYNRLPSGKARLDRTLKHRKIHDWVLYVDILQENDHDLVDCVKFHMNSESFDPPYFTSFYPNQTVNKNDGTTVWRFSTRLQTYTDFGPISVIVRGRGGTNKVIKYKLVLSGEGGVDSKIYKLNERRKLRPFKPMPLWKHNFGIELELTASSNEVNLKDAAKAISTKAREPVQVLNYSKGKKTTSTWKLVPDESIACNINDPYCTKFELVSPILNGGEGLHQCYHIVQNGLGSLSTVKVNKSMGFHVHVDATDISLRALKNICQNFIKYEDAIDSFLPPSRRTGSEESSKYCKSNMLAISFKKESNKLRHDRIEKCTSMKDLFEVMNPKNDRYYKLNFQNLAKGRQQTIEFRQHSATSDYSKIQNWVRFCMAFVHNSIRFKSPSSLKDNTSIDDQFDKLFSFVIKDRYLRNFYQERKQEFGKRPRFPLPGKRHCCAGCKGGHGSSENRMQRPSAFELDLLERYGPDEPLDELDHYALLGWQSLNRGPFGEELQPDPDESDEGFFLKEYELYAWHHQMKQKVPEVFTADDELFGEQTGQYEFGTKLMCYFNGEPNYPMRCEVRGSRWMLNEPEGRAPGYVILMNGELSQIHLTSVHEDGGWKVGWDLDVEEWW